MAFLIATVPNFPKSELNELLSSIKKEFGFVENASLFRFMRKMIATNGNLFDAQTRLDRHYNQFQVYVHLVWKMNNKKHLYDGMDFMGERCQDVKRQLESQPISMENVVKKNERFHIHLEEHASHKNLIMYIKTSYKNMLRKLDIDAKKEYTDDEIVQELDAQFSKNMDILSFVFDVGAVPTCLQSTIYLGGGTVTFVWEGVQCVLPFSEYYRFLWDITTGTYKRGFYRFVTVDDSEYWKWMEKLRVMTVKQQEPIKVEKEDDPFDELRKQAKNQAKKLKKMVNREEAERNRPPPVPSVVRFDRVDNTKTFANSYGVDMCKGLYGTWDN